MYLKLASYNKNKETTRHKRYHKNDKCGDIWTSCPTRIKYLPGGLLGNPKNGTEVKTINIPPIINPNHHAPTQTGLSGVMFSL